MAMTSSAIKLVDNDRGYRALFERAKNMRGKVSVGLHAKDGEEQKTQYDGNQSALTLLEVATLHEFGQGEAERSFLRVPFDESAPKLEEEVRAVGRSAIKGPRTLAVELQELGDRFQATIVDRMLNGIKPPLSPVTIEAKAKAGLDAPEIPLVATRQLIDSIKVRLRKVTEADA